uniref:Ankyrin repeat protein n=1 Tax=Marseillevirus LCMAC101 TaxID=2506602 RepID=A0A481YT42_9VIRU|nr:MAG: ankyrin repeat protein [Marseillevirus LCMAC101]
MWDPESISAVCAWTIQELDYIKEYSNATIPKHLLDDHGLHMACFLGDLELVKIFVEQGADVNLMHGMYLTPLHQAAMTGHHKIIQYLLENGANINLMKGDISPIVLAWQKNQIETIKFLIRNRADITSKTSWLEEAKEKGHDFEDYRDIFLMKSSYIKPAR